MATDTLLPPTRAEKRTQTTLARHPSVPSRACTYAIAVEGKMEGKMAIEGSSGPQPIEIANACEKASVVNKILGLLIGSQIPAQRLMHKRPGDPALVWW